MKGYLKKNKIKNVFGSLYYPRSRGSVEAFSKTIQNFLISAKDSTTKKLI